MVDANTADTAKKPKAPRTRSPNYPRFDLKAAVDKLTPLFAGMKRHAVGVTVAVELMGFKYTGSTGKLALATIRSFGFFEDDRGAKDSLVKLSPLALDIAADYPAGSAHWTAAIKKAALNPKIHRHLWNRYGASLPPDDEIRRYLARDLKFNDNAVGPFIAQFKATIAFAKLGESDTIPGTDDDDLGDDEGEHVETVVEDHETGRAPAAKGKSLATAGPFISFPLSNGNVLEIRLRQRVSAKDFERIKTLVDLSEDSLVEQDD